MSETHKVFDLDALAKSFPAIEVKLGGKNYRMKATLSAGKMAKIAALERNAQDDDYSALGAKLASYLDTPADTFSGVDIRLIARAIRFVEQRLKEQSEGKDGNPTAAAPKKSPKSLPRSRRSSK